MSEYYIEFFNHHNFGDDLFIYCITKTFPNITFHINGSKKNLRGLCNIKNLKIHYDNIVLKKVNSLLRRIYKQKDLLLSYRARNCVAVIYLGGSLFIEPKDSNLDDYYLNNIRRHINGKKFFLIGANFGPYRTENFYNHFLSEFATYNLVSFRDIESYNAFNSLSNVQYAPDIVFSIQEWFASFSKIDKNYVLFSVVGETVVENYLEYKNQIVNWIKEYISNGFFVVLLAMCNEQGDLDVCNEIFKIIDNSDSIKIVSYEDDLLEIINYIASADFVIGTRFHSIVTSLALSVPVLPLIYSKKTFSMLKDCGFNGIQIDTNEISKYTFNEIEQNRLNGNQLNTKQLAEDSKKHFSFIY